jgi:hypothetical protein
MVGSCRTSDADQLLRRLNECVGDVADWMSSNRLQINPAKTEFMSCHSARRACSSGPLSVGDVIIPPAAVVRDLGVMLDATVSMRAHVDLVVSQYFRALRNLRSSVGPSLVVYIY